MKLKKTLFATAIICAFTTDLASQNVIAPGAGPNWRMGGNNGVGSVSTIFGTMSGLNQPIFIYTGGAYRAQFTTGGALTNGVYPGDGLRIMDPQSNNIGHLDLWTGASQTTHIKWDGSGEISGQHTRFEIIGHYGGIWMNAQTTIAGPARFFFNTDGNEVGRFNPYSLGGFMRIGLNPSGVDAQRRLEVFDANNAPQFRITQTQSIKYAEFQVTSTGDLAILPHDLTATDINRFTGIQTTTPGNTLEINSQAPFPGPVGTSGLRFHDMQYPASTPVPLLPNQGVLSVDYNGDVIYVQAPNPGFGSCSQPALLTQSSAIDLNNFNFHFLGQQPNDKVGIGTTCSSGLFAKLTVLEKSGTGFFGNTFGADIENYDEIGSNYGVFALSTQNSVGAVGNFYTGGLFVSNGSKNCIGVEGRAIGQASRGAINTGGKFSAQNGASNVGIYATAPISSSNFAAWFDGNMMFNGTLSGINNVLTSDVMFKRNIDTINNALQIIMQLAPKTFYYDTANIYGMNFDDHQHYGFIAQDVQTVIPSLVGISTKPATYDSLGNVVIPSVTYRTLSYNDLIAFLTKGIQEQQRKLDSITQTISAMQMQMNSCCSSNARAQNSNSNQIDVNLNNSENIVLNQNVPNPFAEQTTINFFLPDNVQKAQMLFYDAQGKLIKAVDLTERGNGQLNIFADDLSNGTYSYALVADGKVVDTKKMVKIK